jgi:hypothetical protein
VHAACARVDTPPEVYEFTSYHAAAQAQVAGRAFDPEAGAGRLSVGRFLPGSDQGETVALDHAARSRKREMFECFATQQHMLEHFGVDEERFRPSPAYDFTAAPHPGPLLYESFGWTLTGKRWRLLAQEALKTLGAANHI